MNAPLFTSIVTPVGLQLQRLSVFRKSDAGVVEQNIEAAVPPGGRFDQPLEDVRR